MKLNSRTFVSVTKESWQILSGDNINPSKGSQEVKLYFQRGQSNWWSSTGFVTHPVLHLIAPSCMPHASYLTGKRKEMHFILRPPLPAFAWPFLCKFSMRHFPLKRDVWKPWWVEPDASGAKATRGPRMLAILNQYDKHRKAGRGSTLKDSRRSFKWVEMMCIYVADKITAARLLAAMS